MLDKLDSSTDGLNPARWDELLTRFVSFASYADGIVLACVLLVECVLFLTLLTSLLAESAYIQVCLSIVLGTSIFLDKLACIFMVRLRLSSLLNWIERLFNFGLKVHLSSCTFVRFARVMRSCGYGGCLKAGVLLIRTACLHACGILADRHLKDVLTLLFIDNYYLPLVR